MKPVFFVSSALLILAGFGIGRWTADREPTEAPPTVATFRAALKEQDVLARSLAMARFLDNLGPRDVADAVEALEENRIGVDEYELKMIMFSWTRFDAPGAFEWAQTDIAGRNEMAARAAMFAWGYRDPHGAIEKLKEIGRDDPRSVLHDSAVSGWSHSEDVAGVTDYIASMPEGKERGIRTNHLAALIANEDPENVIRWAEAVPENAPNRFKRVAYMRAMSALAARDPERAMRWYEEHQGNEYTETALDVLARRLVDHHDPEALFAWLLSLSPPPGSRESAEVRTAVRAGYRFWLHRKPEEATAWLEHMDVIPPELDPAVAELARHRLTSGERLDPTGGLAWAMRIHDPELRKDTAVPIARRWLGRDPEAMEAWLAGADLPKDYVDAIRSDDYVEKSFIPAFQSARKPNRRPR